MGQHTKKKPSLSKDQRTKVQEYLSEERRENMFGDGCEDDMIWHGINLKGLNDMTDEELVDELHEICDVRGLTSYTEEEMVDQYGDEGCIELNLLKECEFTLCIEKALLS